MNDAFEPDPTEEAEDHDLTRRVVITDPNLPDFPPLAELKEWDTPLGPVVGFDYEGDDSSLLTPDEREAIVRAAKERDKTA